MLELDIEVDRRELTVAVALAVGAGERVALFGPSGAGKTTVLDAVAGLASLRRGRIRLDGRRVDTLPTWRRRVALLRQQAGLFPHLDVRANLSYASGSRGRDGGLDGWVAQLGLGDILDVRPDRLSGGQRQRVALARALGSDFACLLLDEPYTGLDARLRGELTSLVRAEVAARGVPGVLVAHELVEAQAFADRLAVLDGGQLLQVGTPHEVVRRPTSPRVAALVGYRGFVTVATGARSSPSVVAVHPDRVRAGHDAGPGIPLTGVVRAARPAGAGFEVDLDVAGETVTCRLGESPPTAGERLEVTAVDPPVFGSDDAPAAVPSAPAS